MPRGHIMPTQHTRLTLTIAAAFFNPTMGMTFRPNCTAPGKESNLVLSSNIRGTFDILWSSLFTLLICTWTVQHLNIPTQVPLSRYKIISWVLDLRYKVKWMLLTLVLPEFLVGKALQDYSRARASISYLDGKNGYAWTTTHGFYADMGGYVLKARQCLNIVKTVPAPIYLNCRSLHFACTGDARAESLIDTIPNITQKEIEDKSKGDFFVKATAVVQVSWMIVQTIVRGARGLAVSQLEIAVLAYSACTIITYILYLKKPQNVKVPTVILLKREFGGKKLTTQHQEAIRECRPHSWFTMSLRLFRYKGMVKDHRNVLDPIPNDARYDDVKSLLFTEKSLLTRMDDGFVIAGLVFGSLHCAAWNFAFPTRAEQLLWRISSVVTAGALPLYYSVLLCDIHITWPKFRQLPLSIIEILLALAYLLARLFLMAEVFRSLFYLPPSAFITTWSAQIPHVT